MKKATPSASESPHKKTEIGFYSKVVKGGAWIIALKVAQQFFVLGRWIILGRLIAPSEFGLLGIAILTMATLESFTQSGFRDALIQKEGNIQSYLDTAWTINIFRSIILYIILFLSAPYIALFFDCPNATLVIQITGISFLLSGSGNIGSIYFSKNLEFNKQFFLQISGVITNFAVSVTLALIYKNVWALVWGNLASNTAIWILSYCLHPHRPRLNWDWNKTKELWVFGKWILATSFVALLLNRGNEFVLGKYLGVTMLAYYQFAYKIANIPTTEIINIVSSITFPAYSKIRTDIPRLREAFLKVLRITTFIAFPVTGLIFIFASDFTQIFLGEKWMAMVPALQLLALFGLIKAVFAHTGSLFKAVGKPTIPFRLLSIRTAMMLVIIYPLVAHYGLTGACWAIIIPAILIKFIAIPELLKILELKLPAFFGEFIPSLVSTALTIAHVMLLQYLISNHTQSNVGIGVFSILVIFAILLHLGFSYLFNKKMFREIGSLFKTMKNQSL